MITENYPELGDALIMRSSFSMYDTYLKINEKWILHERYSGNNYHVIFDNNVKYDQSCNIIDTLVHLDVLSEEYLHIRKFRGDMTLRVSPIQLSTRLKPAPTPVIGIYSELTKHHDGMIRQYLQFWEAANSFLSTNLNTKEQPNNKSYSTDNSSSYRTV